MSQFLSQWEEYAHGVTDAPTDFLHAAGIMALSGISLGRRWIARGVNGIHPNLYVMLLAGSSRDRKSFCVDDLGMGLLRDVEKRRVGPEDFSPEGLISALITKDGPPRNKLVIPQPEFGKYLARSKQQYGASTSAILCQLYDGSTFEHQRSGKPPLPVKNPRVSLFGGVAFGMLAQHGNPMDWVSGFYARFLWVIPSARRPRNAITPPANPEARNRCVIALRDLKTRLKAARRPLELSTGAREAVEAFTATIPEEGLDAALSASRERLMNTVLKLGLLYQIDVDHCAIISRESMERAVVFAGRSWAATRLAYGESMETPVGKDVNRIWKCLTEAPEMRMARRDIYRKLHLGAPMFNVAVDVLMKLGVVSKCSVAVEGTKKPVVGFVATEAYVER
jgi:hypothetical protein